MIKIAFSTFLLFSVFLPYAHAMPPFIGNDFSGEYTCKGRNDSVGDYEVQVILKLNKVTSHDIYGIYDFSTETNNKPTYSGQILAKGHKFAMTFKLLNESTFEFNTGIGDFKKIDAKRWAFQNTYYEPDGNGGNFGNDYCKMNIKQKEQEKISEKPKKPNKNAS
jgi:hypothetical protein